MSRCAECDAVYGHTSVILEYAKENLRFCSFECVLAHAATRVRRRIIRNKRRLQRFLRQETSSNNCPREHQAKITGRLL